MPSSPRPPSLSPRMRRPTGCSNYRITTATAKGVEGFPFDLNQTVLPSTNVTYTK